jgi:hypothetical protein
LLIITSLDNIPNYWNNSVYWWYAEYC